MIKHCQSIHGYTTSVDYEPKFESCTDVLLVPLSTEGAASGVYSRGRHLITAAATFHGVPSLHLGGGANFFSSVNPEEISELIEEPMIFGGFIDSHYGHFITSCLSRYWWLSKFSGNDKKIVILNREGALPHFDKEYVRECFASFGVGPERFVYFDKPVIFSSLDVPAASFEENNISYRLFSTFCNEIGERLTSNVSRYGLPPIYMSKSRLVRGISRIVNEAEFENRLADRGIEICHPQDMPFREQILAFKGGRTVCGAIGSAIHTGIFSPMNKLVILNDSDLVWSNQILFDKANRNRTIYVYSDTMRNLGQNEFFHNNFILENPIQEADAYADIVLAA